MKYNKWFLSVIVALNLAIITGGCSLIEEENHSPVSSINVEGNMLIPGGIPVGIYMDTDGVMVIDTAFITDGNGREVNPGEGKIQSGDYIVSLNNEEILTKNQLIECVNNLTGEAITIEVRRENEILTQELTPTLDESGSYKLGLWVRDNLQGLGTLTYVDGNYNFGALGHGIHDVDTSELMEITGGELYRASITGIIQGKVGSPGGLEGMIIYNNYNKMGLIHINDDSGIYGSINNVEDLGISMEALPVARVDEMKKGDAVIYCTIDNKVEEFSIKVTKVNKYEKEVNKGLVIEITDQELIAQTGGIVQGLSGSPIIQNGKIIGAVTHVMVNDPTKGYGIFIENMLEMSETIN